MSRRAAFATAACATAACATLLLACAGDRPPDAAPADRSAASASPPPPSSLAAPGVTAPPVAWLPADACVALDPSESAPAELRGLDSSAQRVATESIEGLTPRDSARLAARLARAVGALPTDTLGADFRELPFAVRSAWRAPLAPGDTIFVAILVRRIPIESEPLEELHTFIASPEPRPGLRDGVRFEWMQRDVGREEQLVLRELVALWRTPGDTLAALLVHEQDGGVLAQLLHRAGISWALRWEGVLPRC